MARKTTARKKTEAVTDDVSPGLDADPPVEAAEVASNEEAPSQASYDPPLWPADRVARRPIASLIPYARNARMHSDEQVATIAASMKEFGWTMPVLVDEADNIIAGHGRVLAGALNGWTTCPVMVASGWSVAQKRAYVLADNKIAELATWDENLVRFELAALAELNFDIGLTGFDFDLTPPEAPTPPDAFPEFGEDIATEHKCPRCGFVWSGKAS